MSPRRDLALVGIAQLDHDFDVPPTTKKLIETAYYVLTYLGYVATSYFEMLQVFQTFMKYVRILACREKEFARKQQLNQMEQMMAAEVHAAPVRAPSKARAVPRS